jgi:histidine triad (HIT) family protein
MAAYDPTNVFARILRDEIPSARVYEGAEFIAFRDIDPKAPTHVLVIPRGEAPVSPAAIEDADADWLGRMIVVARRVAADLGLAESGYRLVFNSGRDAHQEVAHLHLHILGGGDLGPMA